MIVCCKGLESNPEAQRLGLRGQTSAVDCSKNIIGLELFGYFLFQDKKYRGFGVATPMLKIKHNKIAVRFMVHLNYTFSISTLIFDP